MTIQTINVNGRSIELKTRKQNPNRVSTCKCCQLEIYGGQTIARVEYQGRPTWAHIDCVRNLYSKSLTEPAVEPYVSNENDVEKAAKLLELLSAGGMTSEERELLQAIADRVEAIENNPQQPSGRIEITKNGETFETPADEVMHKNAADVLELIAMREEIFLVGPTGSTKTHTCGQIADIVFGDQADKFGVAKIDNREDRFGFISMSAGTSEAELFGRLLPVGDSGKFEYVASEFISKFENGGLFLIDEIDAADPNVLIKLNAAIANGVASVPNRPGKPYAKRHADFICIAAANTMGRGADFQYTGRDCLDMSTLNRFQMGTIIFDYDEDLEAKLLPCNETRDALLAIRRRIADNGIEQVVSTRTMIKAKKFREFGMEPSRIVEKLTTTWSDDERSQVADIVSAL